MADIPAPIQELPPIPDNLTVPQFLLDQNHPARPLPPRGGNPWLIDDTTGRRVSQEELRARTYGLANVLFSEYGVRENDVGMLWKRGQIDSECLTRSSIDIQQESYSGANPDYTTDELVYQLEATKATMMFVYPDSLEATRAAAERMHFFLFSALTLVVVPKFNFVGMLASIAKHRITHLTYSRCYPSAAYPTHSLSRLVPPQVVLLCKHPAVKEYDLSSVRYIMVGAAPLTYEVTEQLIKLFPRAHIGQAYGMTETCTAVTMWSTDTKRGPFGSAGQLIPGTVARVEKPDGTLAGLNEAGHLLIKTPSAALCYANNKQATEETFVNGWVRTGDEVKIDEDKVVWVLDRIKEIMKVRGFQVAPAELEGCILDHEDVSDACVVGVPDEYSGELPLAFVVPSEQAAKRIKTMPGAAEEMKASIMKHVASNKVKYKHLTGVEITDAIPKNPSGKLLRRVLRDRAKVLVRVKAKL
ncbi:hypothetical protein ONZ45_g12969 [Pleurotus djamor]|nr:hypothetical protein ONZ45_g12969 [Pleurotus djamor]